MKIVNFKKTKEQNSRIMTDLTQKIKKFERKYIPKDKTQDLSNLYSLAMFKEDIMHNNLDNSINMIRAIEDQSTKPKFQKLMYFYNVNSLDELNSATKTIKGEVRMGMADPVRTAAIVELQNFIKKNVGKK